MTVNMDSEMEISLKDIGVDFLLVTVNSLTRNKAKNANKNADVNNTTSYELVHTCGNMDVI